MATTDNPLGAFFRGFQSSVDRAQQRQQQAEENALTQQLRQIQLINAQRAMAEAAKTPEQRLSEEIQKAFAVDALKRGALVQAPVGLAGESIALPSAIGQTAAELEAQQTFAPSVQATPLSITTGQPELPSLSDALSQIVVPQVEQPSFNIPSAPNMGFEEPSPIPGFNVSEEAARQKAERDLSSSLALAQAKRAAAPPGFAFTTDENGLQSLVQIRGAGAGTGITTPVTNQAGEQIRARPTAATVRGQRSILAEDEKGTLRNIVLQPGEALPEGYKERQKAADPSGLRKEFNARQEVKSYRELDRQINIMRGAFEQLGTGKSKGPIDQALITTFNKILDPTSVVRESEYARTPEGAALIRRIEGRLQQFTEGGVAFTDDERRDLLQVAEALFARAEESFNDVKDEYVGISEASRIKPELVVGRGAMANQGGQAATAPVTPTALTPAAQEYLKSIGR